MNVFVTQTGRKIAPFDDPPGEILIQNRPLAEWQAEMFAGAQLTRIPERRPPCLVVPDTLFATADTLRAFLAGANGRSAVLVLARSVFGRVSTPVQPRVTETEAGWRFEEVRLELEDGSSPIDVVVDPDEEVRTLPIPGQYAGGGAVELSMPRRPVLTIHHNAFPKARPRITAPDHMRDALGAQAAANGKVGVRPCRHQRCRHPIPLDQGGNLPLITQRCYNGMTSQMRVRRVQRLCQSHGFCRTKLVVRIGLPHQIR